MVAPIQITQPHQEQHHRAHVIQETEKTHQIVSQEVIPHVLLSPTAVNLDQAQKEETEEELKTKDQ